jgi:hypothetical protein
MVPPPLTNQNVKPTRDPPVHLARETMTSIDMRLACVKYGAPRCPRCTEYLLSTAIPTSSGYGMYPLSKRVRVQRVWVRCLEIGPAVYPWRALTVV